MNKDDAELIIEKERQKKLKIQKRMQDYRNNNEFRKKNAEYMKEYRFKQKKILEDANKIINNEYKEREKKSTDKEKKTDSDKKLSQKTKSEKTIKKYTSIINKNHKLFNKTSNIDIKLLSNIFISKLESDDEVKLENDLFYLKDISKFIDVLKNKYTNVLTLRDNINPYLIILQTLPLFKTNYIKLNKFYSELKK
jgi:hypothetical protein